MNRDPIRHPDDSEMGVCKIGFKTRRAQTVPAREIAARITPGAGLRRAAESQGLMNFAPVSRRGCPTDRRLTVGGGAML